MNDSFIPNPEINHDNLHKHGFSLKTAQAVFADPYRTDDEYDDGELQNRLRIETEEFENLHYSYRTSERGSDLQKRLRK